MPLLHENNLHILFRILRLFKQKVNEKIFISRRIVKNFRVIYTIKAAKPLLTKDIN